MNIYLLRHGETDWNQEGRLQGHTDIPLNQNGRMQINHATEVLTNLQIDIDLIISSPLSRAHESAVIVAERLSYEKDNIVIEPLLIERCFGVGEGLTIVEREEKYPSDIYPEMETYEELMKEQIQRLISLGKMLMTQRVADQQWRESQWQKIIILLKAYRVPGNPLLYSGYLKT